MLYRGYNDDGQRVQGKYPFKPTMFLQSNKPSTEWKALDGSSVEPIELESMSEASDFVKKYEDIDNFKIHGNENFVTQFIGDKFPGVIKYDLKKIEIGNIDIEVASDDGFPEPGQANYPVISIAYRTSRDGIYYVWGLDSYDAGKTELDLQGDFIRYVRCKDLMLKFLTFWSHNCPDIITGWNIRFFDIRYLINRTNRILGEEITKKFSPFGITKYRQIGLKGKNLDAYEIYGVQQVDYCDLFQKFGYSYGSQSSYSLDHISSVVLGEKKLSY
jgi:DNA polymerase elongation subunit (family B)